LEEAAGLSDELRDRTDRGGKEERAGEGGANDRSDKLLSGSEIEGHW
jgi:hypothetical protein